MSEFKTQNGLPESKLDEQFKQWREQGAIEITLRRITNDDLNLAATLPPANSESIGADLGEDAKLCALVISHKKASPGTTNPTQDLSELDFNDALAQRIERHVRHTRVQRVYRRTYATLPGDINELKPDFVIRLHCNTFNRKATGTEVLYYHKSFTGKKTATILQGELVGALSLNDRGIKAKRAEERGGSLLKNTNAPCLIAEPFFIDNDTDLETAQHTTSTRLRKPMLRRSTRSAKFCK
jgi:N-acetylmuramoyl-L-alanine amidase